MWWKKDEKGRAPGREWWEAPGGVSRARHLEHSWKPERSHWRGSSCKKQTLIRFGLQLKHIGGGRKAEEQGLLGNDEGKVSIFESKSNITENKTKLPFLLYAVLSKNGYLEVNPS